MRSFLALFGSIWAAGIASAAPSVLQLPFSTNSYVGPDGPWNFMTLEVDYPSQKLSFLPSLTETSMIVPDTACQNQSSACTLPLPPLYRQTGAQNTLAENNSVNFDASKWSSISQPLRISGIGRYMMDRFTLLGNIVDYSGFARAESFTATYPGGNKYTLNVGMFSLLGDPTTISWLRQNGTTHTTNRTLPAVYNANLISSISYGLHVGSATHNITGSLCLGGYDSSRVISQPITSQNNQPLSLSSLALNVSSGSSVYAKTGSQLPFSISIGGRSGLQVNVDPGVPYLYLPKAVCDDIASQLPVDYNQGLNIYTWRTTAVTTSKLLESQHYLSFTFGTSSSVAVPFALLNLTVTNPLVSKPTQYFPCSPYTPSDGKTYVLGRAFLQAAFLGQNWQTKTTWLAQAPGPQTLPVNVKVIDSKDQDLVATQNPPSWDDTWSNVLSPLNTADVAQIPSTESKGSNPDKGLSTGAAAGIGVASALVFLLVVGSVVFFLRQKRREQKWRAQDRKEGPVPTPGYQHPTGQHPIISREMHDNAIHEAPGEIAAAEKPGNRNSNEKPPVLGYHVVPQSGPVELPTR